MGVALHHDITERYLSIAADCDPILVPDGYNGGGMHGGHKISSLARWQNATIGYRTTVQALLVPFPRTPLSRIMIEEPSTIPQWPGTTCF
jgi:hypothetical protein